MRKQTRYLLIGIGIASILAGIYAAIRSGEIMDSTSEVFIGATLIGIVIIEWNKKDKIEQNNEIPTMAIIHCFAST